MRAYIKLQVLGCILLGLAGCGEGKADRQAPAAPEKTPAGKTIAEPGRNIPRREAYPFGQGTVAVKGTVKIMGAVPKPMPLVLSPECQKAHGDQPLQSEALAAGPAGELRDCFVFVSAGLEKYTFEPPEAVVKIEQLGCRYEPHAVAFMAGQTLEFRNSDPFAHNVHDSRDQFCKQQAQQGETDRVEFKDAVVGGILKCDIHPWMNCVYAAFEHPFFAVTDAHGAYALPCKLVPGKYTISCYHYALKSLAKEVEVQAGAENVDISFAFKQDK